MSCNKQLIGGILRCNIPKTNEFKVMIEQLTSKILNSLSQHSLRNSGGVSIK